MSDDLFDIDEKKSLSREAAAAQLRALADAIASNNSVQFEKGGKTFTVAIPATVDLKVEVELGDENELEIELTW